MLILSFIYLIPALYTFNLDSLFYVIKIDIQKRFYNSDNSNYIEIVDTKFLTYNQKKHNMWIQLQIKVNAQEVESNITEQAIVKYNLPIR
jgi:hypothetical protein